LTTAVAVAQDVSRGVVDRFRTFDDPAAALLASHVAASLLRGLVSSVLVVAVAVALALGFRPHAGLCGWLAAAAVLGAGVPPAPCRPRRCCGAAGSSRSACPRPPCSSPAGRGEPRADAARGAT
jgi:hypothetical protein